MTTEIKQKRLVELTKAARKDKKGNLRWRAYGFDITEGELVELFELFKHGDFEVRMRVMEHLNTPVEVLVKGARDRDPDVRRAVMNNPNTPIELLKIGAEDTSWEVRETVMRNANTPVDVLVKGAEDCDELVRGGVMNNPNTPIGILKNGLNDKHPYVCAKALNALKERTEDK
jgi:hypothetical protein